MTDKKKSAPRERKIFVCTSCGAEYRSQRNNFMKSNSSLYLHNDGYVTVCRKCIDDLYRKMVGVYGGDIESAIKHCCMLFDIYYNKNVVLATASAVEPQTRMGMYPSKLNMQQYRAKDKTYLDYVLEDMDKPNSDVSAVDFLDDEDRYKASSETISFFGKGYTNEQYEYLQGEYTDWTTRYECETKVEEELFKAISIAQLKIHEIRQNDGSGKDLETAVKTFQNLLDTQNITPKKTSIDTGSEQETFGTLIRKLENERPVSDPQEQWKDIDGINKYIDTWFFGQLCELVDINNPKEEDYLEEKAKYEIKPPQQDNDFGGNETSLLERLAKKKDNSGGDDFEQAD